MLRLGSGALLLTAFVLLALGGDPGAVEVLGAPPPPRSSGHLDALTYNVAGLPQVLSSSRPADFTPLISPLLNGYDLVLLQEDFCYHDALVGAADHAFRSCPQVALGTLLGDGLNRLSRFRFEALSRVRWAESCGLIGGYHDRWAAKGFTLGRVQLAPGLEIDVYNLHADAGHEPGDLRARRVAFAQLAEFIARHSDGRAVIVGGDFNLCWSSPADRAAFDALLASTRLHDVANRIGVPDNHIDRFLFRSGPTLCLEPVSCGVATEFVNRDGRPLSDHPAIRVRFAWRRTRTGGEAGPITAPERSVGRIPRATAAPRARRLAARGTWRAAAPPAGLAGCRDRLAGSSSGEPRRGSRRPPRSHPDRGGSALGTARRSHRRSARSSFLSTSSGPPPRGEAQSRWPRTYSTAARLNRVVATRGSGALISA